MKLVAPPLYVLTTATLDKNRGVEVRVAWLRAGLPLRGFRGAARRVVAPRNIP
jgi:hypothetical protein